MRSPQFQFVCQYLLPLCLLIPIATIESSIITRPLQAQAANLQTAEQEYNAAREIMAAGSLLVAMAKLQTALKIYQTLGDRQGAYNCQIELARIDYQQAQYQQALAKLRLAAPLVNYSSQDGRAKTLAGLIALALGDYDEALSNLRVGVHQLQVSGAKDPLETATVNEARIALGEVFTYRGAYQEAESHLYQALNVAHHAHLRRRAYNALGSIQLEIGQDAEALKTFEQAYSVSNIPGDRLGKAQTLENLGRAYQAQGNKNQALKQYQIALGELRSIGAWSRQVYVLNNLGRLAVDLGLNNRALEYFQNAEGTLSNSGGVGRVITYINLGYYYSQRKQYSLAKDYLERGLSWARSNGDRIGEGKALSQLGAIEMQSQNYPLAVEMLTASIQVFESLRPGLRDEQKISLGESQKQSYDLLQQAYVAQKQPGEALTIAERGRARAFLELLAQRISQQSTTEIDLTPPSLSAIKAIAQKRQATIVNYSIIEDSQGEEVELYIWVVNPQGEVNFRALDLVAIKEKFRTSLASVANNSRNAAAGGLDLRQPRLQDYVISFRGENGANPPQNRFKLGFPRDAYKLLIEPIKDLLPQNPEDLVIFIPQEALFLVPFPGLQNDAGEFLIEQHTIQIAPSIQTLGLKPTNTLTLDRAQALVVGNPSPMPESLASLPGAEAEAQAIAKMLNTTPLIGQAATEERAIAQMEQSQLIHLATHGLFDEYQGLQSSLAFAVDQDNQGFLTAEEILKLKLNADLVVLSACNTGRGKITGDGVIGLSRSFLLAGANSTLVSLWYVPDLATSTLMTDFYRQLQVNPNQAQALRQAMLNTMKEYPAPYEWAAFMLVGH